MRAALVAAAVALLATHGVADSRAAAPAALVLTTLSTRADLVSGGDVLVEVVPAGARVFAGDAEVTGAFTTRPDGRHVGLVTGLPVGRTVLTATARGRRASLPVDNHPRTGPIIAGPQVEPWLCTVPACGASTQHRSVYRSTNPAEPAFKPYDPAATDVATTTTDDGREVPFVVRVETGVLDRAFYNVAVLADPSAWTGKVLWPFGGDCKPWHQQDPPVDALGITPFDDVASPAVEVGGDEAIGSIFGNGNADEALGRGWLVANSANNKLGSRCDTVVSAEAMLMLKEHVIERYGEIRYTIGAGSSGGSMEQLQLATAYPGLLDGIQPMGTFPDIWEMVQEATDCHVLNHYFDTVSPHLWRVPAQQDAVTGALVGTGCRLQLDGPRLGTPNVGSYSAMWLDPSNELGCGLPAEQVYEPATNPGGVRCTLPDYMDSIFGARAEDGFANRPYDNVGVQYGLAALHDGSITAEQFVDLNEKVGGLDIDWQPQTDRSVADAPAVDVLHRAGLITHGEQLASIPIIDIRGPSNADIHADFHSYVLRARLDRDIGHHDNHVLFTGARPLVGDPTAYDLAFDLIDEWVGAVHADTSDAPLAEKVRRHRPAAAADACWVEGRRVDDAETCATLFPHYGDPRLVAGAPATDDVVQCRLRPVGADDYPSSITPAHLARLRAAFPTGVCDYTAPGVGQVAPTPWTTFAGGPGGRPLGPPPTSTASR